MDEDGCKLFMADHIVDCEKVLQRLELKVDIQSIRDSHGGTLVQNIQTEAILGKSGCHHGNERRMQISNGGEVISSYLCIRTTILRFPTMFTQSRSCTGYTKKGAEVQVGGRAHRGNEEFEWYVGGDTSFKKSHVQGRDANLRNGRYKTNWD